MTTLVRRTPDAIVATYDQGPLYVRTTATAASAVELILGDTLIELSRQEADHLARSIAPEITLGKDEPHPEELMNEAVILASALDTAIASAHFNFNPAVDLTTATPDDLEAANDAIAALLETLRDIREDVAQLGRGDVR